MAGEEECHYSDDTSEPSNIASLQTDFSSPVHCPNVNRTPVNPACNKDCTCHPVNHLASGSPPPLKCPMSSALATSTQVPHQCQLTTQHQPNVQCFCNAYNGTTCSIPIKYKEGARSLSLWNRFSWKWPRRAYLKHNDDTYEVKLKKNYRRYYPKAYVCCKVSEGIPKQQKVDISKVKPPKYEEDGEKEPDAERIDIYYFDHGNSAYYRTTDSPPILATERCAEKTDHVATRFWAEIFGTIHIGIAFVTAFILQLLRFILFSIIRPLTVGVLQMLADYFIKPFLAIIFNALIQPILILLYNIATSFKDLCEPIAEAIGFFLREIAQVFRSFRIVEVKNTSTTGSGT